MRQKKAVRDQLLKALMAQLEFDLPESIVASRRRAPSCRTSSTRTSSAAFPRRSSRRRRTKIYQNAAVSARDRVKGAFILNRIAASEKLSVSDGRADPAGAPCLAQQNNTTPEKTVKAIQARNAVGEVRQDILVGKVLEFLEKINAVIEERRAVARGSRRVLTRAGGGWPPQPPREGTRPTARERRWCSRNGWGTPRPTAVSDGSSRIDRAARRRGPDARRALRSRRRERRSACERRTGSD
jgi:hypothetical protein